jgi:hypothetical protein
VLVPADFDPQGHLAAKSDMRSVVRKRWRLVREDERDAQIRNLRLDLDNICQAISATIRNLPSMDCHDPRVVPFRAGMFRRAEDPSSIYGQLPFSRTIAEKIDEMDSFFGEIRPELSCL